jgi:hypothetical protein
VAAMKPLLRCWWGRCCRGQLSCMQQGHCNRSAKRMKMRAAMPWCPAPVATKLICLAQFRLCWQHCGLTRVD